MQLRELVVWPELSEASKDWWRLCMVKAILNLGSTYEASETYFP